MDSLSTTELTSSLQTAIGIELPATLVFEAPTARSILAKLVTVDALPTSALPEGQQRYGNKVAIASSSLRLPAGVSSFQTTWRVTQLAGDLIGEVPLARWLPSDPAIVAGKLTATQQQCLRLRHQPVRG